MDLSGKEKAGFDHFSKRWPPGKARDLLSLYSAIKAGQRKTLSDLSQDERMIVDILWEQGLIYYGPERWTFENIPTRIW